MKLIDWLKHQGMSQSELARQLGLNKAAVSLWLSGKQHPTYKNYLKIKELTKGRVSYEEVY
jgi:transcriptional regulator with XRE-family HTH domain